jgi:hypothetical protein
MSEPAPLPKLPLPIDTLPAAIQRFCDPKGPAPARLMAAKGLVPVRGHDQVTMLAQLAADAAPDVRDTATRSLKALPAAVLHPACEAAVPAPVLELLTDLFLGQHDVLERIITNANTHDFTLERIARNASEALSERMAVNEARLLTAPRIIEALYKNRNTRMSTADRLIEFAARNKLELTGIPAFKDHVEALQGQLIPEPTDEPLPQDVSFSKTLVFDGNSDSSEVFEEGVTGEEQIKEQFKPLSMQIAEMTKAEKLRMAMVGSKAARALLVRDHNKQVAFAAISSPQTTTAEAADIAKSKEVSEEVLRYIGNKKDWIKAAEVKHNLVFNPKCPVGVSLKFIGHMRLDELRSLTRSRNVSAQIRSLASQWIARKEKN